LYRKAEIASMDNQPLTPPYSWGPPIYFDPQFTEFPMQPDIISDEQANPDPQGQFWMASILNPGMIEAGDESNPGMIDSGIESRSSTLSTYPESSTFNGDNLVSSLLTHPSLSIDS
jgi:hypothetical protein